MLLAIDLETTGLVASECQILEIGAQVWDDELEKILGSFHDVVHPVNVGHWSTWYESLDPIVREMHQKSGLFENLIQGEGRPWVTVRQSFSAWLTQWPKGELPVIGNSVRFDRNFLEFQAPEINDYLHYRIVDLSSIRELARRWKPELTEREPMARKLHRSMPDLADSIELARFYKRELFS